MRTASSGARVAKVIAAALFAAAIPPSALAIDTECPVPVTACSAKEIEAIPVSILANPHWLLQVTPSGYSDFGIFTLPPFPRRDPRAPDGPGPLHEMFSGEWAAAVGYNNQPPIWLERCFRYPEWKTNSNFETVQEALFPDDPDGDGMNEGTSITRNDLLEITIHYDMELIPGGVAMGKGTADTTPLESSNPFALKLTYDLKNISANTLTGVSLYQFSHPHPANAEKPVVSAGYDDVMHATGGLQNYRYDITGFATNSGLADGHPTGSTFNDHVGFSSRTMPPAWGLGTYQGHNPGDPGLPSSGGMKPLRGEHCDVENRMLANERTLLGAEAAGSMRLDLGTLAPNETKSAEVLLTFQSRARGVPATSCLRILDTRAADPRIQITRGACTNPIPTATTWDVVAGSIYDLAVVPGCDPTFDCTQLINLRGLAKGYGLDRITLADDAHVSDTLYYLVRRAGRFTPWGDGNQGPGAPPLRRYYFTPVTAPGVDACDAIP
jgi:hypothetical protein